MRWCLIVIMGILLFVTSCATTAKAPEVGYKSVASQEKIVYLRGDGKGSDLHKYLKVVKELSEYDENGLFTVIVIFNNTRYKKGSSPYLVCDLQFVFFDDAGIELEKTNWQPVMFEAGVDVTVKQISMNPHTKGYKLYVRDPRTTQW